MIDFETYGGFVSCSVPAPDFGMRDYDFECDGDGDRCVVTDKELKKSLHYEKSECGQEK